MDSQFFWRTNKFINKNILLNKRGGGTVGTSFIKFTNYGLVVSFFDDDQVKVNIGVIADFY